MKRSILYLIALAIPVFAALSEETRTIEKKFPVKASQRIELRGFSSADVQVRSWERNEVSLRIEISVSSSDGDVERKVIQGAALNDHSTDESLVLTLSMPEARVGERWGLGSIFGRSYIKRTVKGEVYVPSANAFLTDNSYGALSIENIAGQVDLIGKGNTISIRNCAKLGTIKNDYGTTKIVSSGGTMRLSGQSSTVSVETFNGSAEMDADYSTLNLRGLTGMADITAQSGSLSIEDIKGGVRVDAKYAKFDVRNVGGAVEIRSQSATIRLRDTGPVDIDAPYSRISIATVRGSGKQGVHIKGQSGNIDLTETTGDIAIENPYGNTTLRSVVGNVTLSGQSGTINAEGVKGNWTSDTRYSNIRLGGISGREIIVRNSSGTVSIEAASVVAKLEVDNEYGNINVGLPKGFQGTVNLEAEYGNIETDLNVKVKKLGGSAIAMGTIGTGAGSISLTTKSGSIRLEER